MPEATSAAHYSQKPRAANAVLVLGDGRVFWGQGLGAESETVGEVCFNTSMTGYQEIMTDPSYAGQIITFTFPHIGNVGANREDVETVNVAARGLVLREDITAASSWRAAQGFDAWLVANGITGICGLDTRALTHAIREQGAPNGVIAYSKSGAFDLAALQRKAKEWPGLNGMDLVPEVTTRQRYSWDEAAWSLGSGYARQTAPRYQVVAIDYGAKQNILRSLAAGGCAVTVVPATASAEDILALKPDGVFLSNGPGDPAAVGVYAVPVIKALLAKKVPIFGICLGHQLLALAIGGTTHKLARGHRGANQPVQDLETGRVEITSQNHGFCVDEKSLPANAAVTHLSLFDKSNEGLKLTDAPAFSVQYHPEASPGPHDSLYLFTRFAELMDTHKKRVAA